MTNGINMLIAQGFDPYKAQMNALQAQQLQQQVGAYPEERNWLRQQRGMATEKFGWDRQQEVERIKNLPFKGQDDTVAWFTGILDYMTPENWDELRNVAIGRVKASGADPTAITSIMPEKFPGEEWINKMKGKAAEKPTLIPKGTMGTIQGGKISPLPPELKQPEELNEVQTLSLPDTDPRKIAYIGGKKQIQQAGGQTEAQILAEGGSKAETYIKNKNRLKATEPYFEALGIVTDPDTGKTEVIGYDRRTFKQRREPVPGMPVKPGTIKSVNPVQEAIASAIKESQGKTIPSPKSKAPGGKEKLIHYEVGQDEFYIPESKASKFEIEHPTAKRLSK